MAPTSNSLSSELWVSVLSHLDYFDLKRLRGVSKSCLEYSEARSIQEKLFKAPFDESLLESKCKSGEEIQLHPILSQVTYHLYKRPAYSFKDLTEYDQTAKQTDTFKVEKSSTQSLEKIKDENATNPPVCQLKLFNRLWDTKTIRNFDWGVTKPESDDEDSEEESSGDESVDGIGRIDLKKAPSSSTSTERKAITVGDLLNAIAGHFKGNGGFGKVKWEALPLSQTAEYDWAREDDEAEEAAAKYFRQRYGYLSREEEEETEAEQERVLLRREKQKKTHRNKFVKSRTEHKATLIFYQDPSKVKAKGKGKGKAKSKSAEKEVSPLAKATLVSSSNGGLAADLDHIKIADSKKPKVPLFT